MIEFDHAIGIAAENLHKLVTSATHMQLEEALLSPDESTYHITYSYQLEPPPLNVDADSISPLRQLAKIMGTRREHKVFLIDASTGKFKGFRNKE